MEKIKSKVHKEGIYEKIQQSNSKKYVVGKDTVQMVQPAPLKPSDQYGIKFTAVRQLNSPLLRNTAEFGDFEIPTANSNKDDLDTIEAVGIGIGMTQNEIKNTLSGGGNGTKSSVYNQSNPHNSPGDDLNNSNFYEQYISHLKSNNTKDAKDNATNEIKLNLNLSPGKSINRSDMANSDTF